MRPLSKIFLTFKARSSVAVLVFDKTQNFKDLLKNFKITFSENASVIIPYAPLSKDSCICEFGLEGGRCIAVDARSQLPPSALVPPRGSQASLFAALLPLRYFALFDQPVNSFFYEDVTYTWTPFCLLRRYHGHKYKSSDLVFFTFTLQNNTDASLSPEDCVSRETLMAIFKVLWRASRLNGWNLSRQENGSLRIYNSNFAWVVAM